LDGTTFVQLNFVSAAAFASMAAYHTAPVVYGKAAGGGLPELLAAVGAGSISAWALYEGATNVVRKRRTK
jgi:hypothetical protein